MKSTKNSISPANPSSQITIVFSVSPPYSRYPAAMAVSLRFCRFPARPDLALPEPLPRGGIGHLRCRKKLLVRSSAEASPSVSAESEFDAKVFRHNLTRSKNYNRKGFGHKEETLELLNQEYQSSEFTSYVCVLFSSFSGC